MPIKDEPTFAECAVQYIEAHKAGWSNAKHAYQWSQSIESYANATIGHLAVSAISVEHVHKVLEPIWSTKSETAGRLRGRIEKVLGWAEARGYRQGANPASWKGPLGHMLPALSKVQKIEHHAAVPCAEIPAVFDAIGERAGNGAAALRFVLLTAARSGEVRGARWSEFDLDAKVWTVPAERMKSKMEHRVPLTEEALALMPNAGRPDALVFPGSRPTKALSDMCLITIMRRLRGQGATVHGLRSSFRDWAAEKTDAPREVVEACLAHRVGSEVELAYKRTDFFDKRRNLMEAWCSFVVTGSQGVEVGASADVI
jgi:integrase